jgi:replicative DNA helicase
MHGIIFRRCLEMIRDGKLADAVTVAEHAQADSVLAGALEEVGGAGYLVALLSAAEGRIEVISRARSVRAAAGFREASRRMLGA